MVRPRRSRGHRDKPPKVRKGPSPRKTPRSFILESGTLETLRRQSARGDEFRAFHAAYFGHVASQREEVRDVLTRALARVAEPLEIKRWQRVVPLKHSLAALSARGSVSNRVGGRFNFGVIDERRFTPFPALYLASNRGTALQEQLGEPQAGSKLSQLDLALQNAESIAMVSVSGRIHIALDISKNRHLKPFLDVISRFAVPPELVRWAKRIGLNAPTVVKTVDALRDELLAPYWRIFPALLGVPSNPQFFGNLVQAAGIEGIAFPSSKWRRGSCLAVFPRNFAHSGSFLALDDDPPEGTEMVTRLDKSTWQDLI